MLDTFDDDPDVFLKDFQTYSNQLGKHPPYPSDMIDWFNAILYPPSQDPLYKLPWPIDYTVFKMPNLSYFLTPSPTFQNLSYPISTCNVQDSSMLLTMFAVAYQYLPDCLIEDYDGLLPIETISELNLKSSDLLTIDLIPWANIVRQSFAFAFQSTGTPTMWSTYSIKELAYKVLYQEDQCLVDQFCALFLEAIDGSATFSDVFKGQAPFTNDPLKKLAAAGSCYFDSVYHQMTALHKIQTKKTQQLQAPNDQLVQLYDMIVDSAHHSTDIAQEKASLLSRHLNNNGNSMEAFAPLMCESGHHDLIVVMPWLIMQLQFRDQAYPWRAEFLAP